jgi:hypothetical protein
VTVNVSELVAPTQTSPDPESVAAVGVDPTVITIGVPRLAGVHRLLSCTEVRVIVVFPAG